MNLYFIFRTSKSYFKCTRNHFEVESMSMLHNNTVIVSSSKRWVSYFNSHYCEVFCCNDPYKSINFDLLATIALVTNVERIQIWYNNETQLCFQKIQKICNNWETDIETRCQANRKIQCNDIQTNSSKIYYRISIFIQFIFRFTHSVNSKLLVRAYKCFVKFFFYHKKKKKIDFYRRFETDGKNVYERYETIIVIEDYSNVLYFLKTLAQIYLDITKKCSLQQKKTFSCK